MGIGAVNTPPVINNCVNAVATPYQASPTETAGPSTLPLTQSVPGGTDPTFTASVTDHELNAVNTPNPVGGILGGGAIGNAQPDTLAQSGIGLHVSASQ